MATVQAHAVVELVLALLRSLISRVGNPAVRLHEDCRAKVLFRVPPVRWAGCAAAGAENAFVKAIEFRTVILVLEVLTTLYLVSKIRLEEKYILQNTYVRWLVVSLQVWLDRLVLLVKLRQVWYQVLDDVGMRQWINPGLLGGLSGNSAWPSVSTCMPNAHCAVTYKGMPVCSRHQCSWRSYRKYPLGNSVGM